MNLLDALCERFAGPDNPLAAPAANLRLRLGTIELVEAQNLYRLASDQADLPELNAPLAYLEHPFVLFGGEFVAQTLEELRSGKTAPPCSSHIRYVPLDDDGVENEF
jgi:hypothetical protein